MGGLFFNLAFLSWALHINLLLAKNSGCQLFDLSCGVPPCGRQRKLQAVFAALSGVTWCFSCCCGFCSYCCSFSPPLWVPLPNIGEWGIGARACARARRLFSRASDLFHSEARRRSNLVLAAVRREMDRVSSRIEEQK